MCKISKVAWNATSTPVYISDAWSGHQHQIYNKIVADTWNGEYSAVWLNSNGTARAFRIFLNDIV